MNKSLDEVLREWENKLSDNPGLKKTETETGVSFSRIPEANSQKESDFFNVLFSELDRAEKEYDNNRD